MDAFANPLALQATFDQIPDIVFFVKDVEGRYRIVNRTLAERCGIPHKSIVGRTAEDLFPSPLGSSYLAQDQLVLRTGTEIRDKLELHLYRGRASGWCLTFKTPLRNAGGAIVGLIGISRDIHDADERHPEYSRLAQAVQLLRDRHHEPLRLDDVARSVDLSLDRFERLCKRVFHLTPRQLLARARLDEATRLLRETDDNIASIAYACGYSDHSAFTRQFRATVGLAPSAYRAAQSFSSSHA
ncbi:MAG TPA: AraC family transcriptional regulator [Thermoanaerobaculia bacterium]|jgi:PAS domain S-box-containing protein|nr:AraC family transcriptional regulator [Thermoanaerobaculia bacterium]